MDSDMIKVILNSCDVALKDVEETEEYKNLKNNKEFLPTSTRIIDALSTSLTNLLCYKVSKEAYQRYSVQLHVIKILRDWCRVTDSFAPAHILTNGKHTLTFTQRLIDKYITDEALENCTSVDAVVSVTHALMCLAQSYSCFETHVEKLLIKLSQLECTEKSSQLLCYVAHKHHQFNFKESTLEQIYTSQKSELVEKPLLDKFTFTHNLDTEQKDNSRNDLADQLLEVCAKSSCIFQLTCNFLKEFMIYLDYAPIVLSFVQSVLQSINSHCTHLNKNIVDLYPTRLHAYIIMLQIEPSHHIEESKEYTLKTLQDILRENRDDALILLSHLPSWLEIFTTYLAKT